ncbi:MAG: ABC transporter permease [Verrucomicrobiota bacterium]|nr:ABC transporter permease [Verrucomicrobiota bacterium]
MRRRDGNRGEWLERWRVLGVVMQRELRETAWRKRTFITRALAVLLMTFVLGLIASNINNVGSAGRRQIFQSLGIALTCFIAFLLPILVADVIAAERERGTLGLLFLTPLRPLGIVLGKAVGRLLLILSLVVACGPVVAMTYLLGGVEAIEILKVLSAILVSVIWGGAFCLWISARSATVMSALIWSYVAGLLVVLFLPALQAALMYSSFNLLGDDAILLWAWHPIVCWVALFNTGGSWGGTWMWDFIPILGPLLVAAIWCLLAVRRVSVYAANPQLLLPSRKGRKHARNRAREGAPAQANEEAQKAGRRWLSRLASLEKHPAIWLELNSGAGWNRQWLVGCGLVPVLWLLGEGADSNTLWWEIHEFVLQWLLFLVGFGVMVAGVVAAAGSIAREVETGRFELLLLLPIRPWVWLVLKILKVLLGYGLLAFGLLLFHMLVYEEWGDASEYLAGYFLPWFVILSVAFWISARVKRERTAFELTFAAACVVTVGWMTLMDGMYWWYDQDYEMVIAGIAIAVAFFWRALAAVSRLRRG